MGTDSNCPTYLPISFDRNLLFFFFSYSTFVPVKLYNYQLFTWCITYECSIRVSFCLLTDRCCRRGRWTMNGRNRIKSPVGSRCHYILKRCMAIHLQKQSLVRYVPQQPEASPYWMYDNGYLIFQASTKLFNL